MSVLEEVAKRLKERGYSISQAGNSVVARHPNAPLSIQVDIEGETCRVSLKAENFTDFVDDVKESEENPREYLEEILEDVSRAASEVSALLRSSCQKLENTVQRDVLDLMDIIEDVLET